MINQSTIDFNNGILFAQKWHSFKDNKYPEIGDKIIVKVIDIDDELSTLKEVKYKTTFDVGEIKNSTSIDYYKLWYDEWRLIEIKI